MATPAYHIHPYLYVRSLPGRPGSERESPNIFVDNSMQSHDDSIVLFGKCKGFVDVSKERLPTVVSNTLRRGGADVTATKSPSVRQHLTLIVSDDRIETKPSEQSIQGPHISRLCKVRIHEQCSCYRWGLGMNHYDDMFIRVPFHTMLLKNTIDRSRFLRNCSGIFWVMQ